MWAGDLGLPSRPSSGQAPALTTEVILQTPSPGPLPLSHLPCDTDTEHHWGCPPVTSAAQRGVDGGLLPASGYSPLCPAYPSMLLTLMVPSSKPPPPPESGVPKAWLYHCCRNLTISWELGQSLGRCRPCVA